MTARKHSPAHDYWHPRVEGQLRDAMKAHPEWFTDEGRSAVVSIAKRVVGEIVAGFQLAPVPGGVGPTCVVPGGAGDGSRTVARGPGCGSKLHPGTERVARAICFSRDVCEWCRSDCGASLDELRQSGQWTKAVAAIRAMGGEG